MISRVFFSAVGLSCILIATKIFVDGEFFFAKYGLGTQLGDEKNVISIGLAVVGIYIVAASVFTKRNN